MDKLLRCVACECMFEPQREGQVICGDVDCKKKYASMMALRSLRLKKASQAEDVQRTETGEDLVKALFATAPRPPEPPL